MPAPTLQPLDVEDLRARVRDMYVKVARDPRGEFHFEMGRALAERLGYPSIDLDEVPAEAIEPFAGVGYPLALTAPVPGQTVLDLGSGSGMDVSGFFGRAAAWPSPTSSRTGRFRRTSPAIPPCGPHASVVPLSEMCTPRRSRPPGCAWWRSARIRSTGSSPGPPGTPAISTASAASASWPRSRRPDNQKGGMRWRRS